MSAKIAIVGAGYMADQHARAFAAQPGARIVGIASRTRSRAEPLAAAYGTKAFDSISEMWTETGADVVVVAVNELSTAAVCEQVFPHPWHVLLEKPVGIDLADAEGIKATAFAAGANDRTWVALNRRSYASTRAALGQLVEHGPRLVSILDQQDMESARRSGAPERVVSNYMFANSIHLIDYFHVFCRGKVGAINISSPWTPDAPGHVIATLQFSSGDQGVYQAIWNGPGPWAVAISTPEVRLEMRPLESLTIQLPTMRGTNAPDLGSIDLDFKPGLHFQAAEMLKVLTHGNPNLASLNDAIDSMALCAAIYGLG